MKSYFLGKKTNAVPPTKYLKRGALWDKQFIASLPGWS